MTAKSQRLLIIDDDQGIRHSLARIFRGIGLEVAQLISRVKTLHLGGQCE